MLEVQLKCLRKFLYMNIKLFYGAEKQQQQRKNANYSLLSKLDSHVGGGDTMGTLLQEPRVLITEQDLGAAI